MLAGTASVVGNAQREQAGGAADVRAYASATRFAFNSVAQKRHPARHQRHLIG